MKTIITEKPAKSVVKEVAEPKITPDTVKIKLKYVGVCYSEHYSWKHQGGAFGHEPMGTIVDVGENVKGYNIGDVVSGLWGSTLPGTGGMVQYVVADPKKSTIIKKPDGVRDVDFILEPLACLFSAVSKVRCSMPGTRVCVVGCGYMGCGAISLLATRGCYVVAVDILESSRKDALKYGAREVYTPEEALTKFTENNDRFEAVMEWGETNESLDLAANLTKMCGQLCVGAYHTGDKRMVNMQLLNVRAIDLLSTHPREHELSVTGCKNATRMLGDGTWCFQNIPTMIYPMSKFDQAHTDLETKYGHHMKSVIDMETLDGEPYLAK